MRTKRAANVFLTVFLAFMIPLSLFGDDLYRMTLPGVVVGTPTVEKGVEERTLEDGTVIKQSYAMMTVPTGAVKEKITETGEPEATVFLLMEAEEGCYVTEQAVKVEQKADGRVEITKGLKNKDRVVVASDRDFVAGEKVKPVEENEQTRLHMARQRADGEPVSSHYLKRCMRRNGLVAAMLLVVSVVLVVVWKKWIPKRFSFLGYIVAVVWCVLACVCIKEFVVIPSEWIPRRLIDFKAWAENMGK